MSDLYHIFTVTEETQGIRLDKFLAQSLPDTPRTAIQELIKQGKVSSKKTNLKLLKTSQKTELDDSIQIEINQTKKEIQIIPLEMPLNIIFEDDDLIVINKPIGLVVHPGAGAEEKTLVHGLMHHTQGNLSNINGVERPGIIHRLDKDTTGLMIVAKNNETHEKLSDMLQKRDIKRHYLALVWGMPNPREGTIDTFYGRDPNNRLKMAVTDEGKEATTHYHVIKPLGLHSALIECTLETGRTHQIRVHLTHIGYPIIGDKTYTPKNIPLSKHISAKAQKSIQALKRQALHAYRLEFVHPRTDEFMSFTSDLPKDIQEICQDLCQ